jgi:hypothetical protein
MARRFADQCLGSGQWPTTRQASRVSVHRAITRTAIPRALHVIASFTNFPVCSLSRVSSNRSTLVDVSVQTGAGERIGDLPLVAKVARESTEQLPDKPVAHREQVPDAIRIPPAADASAATVADRAPAQFAVRSFIVRLMSQGSETGIAKFTLDIDR